MHNTLLNLQEIEKEIYSNNRNKNKETKLIVVTKNFQINNIKPLITYGHIHFGENRVQEAFNKWKNIKNENKNIRLHMIGKLQSNKVKYAVSLFDYIHSLDSMKLAEKISIEQKKINKSLEIFIQVNIGNEIQKSGIKIEDLKNFHSKCSKDLGLNIIGLMCIPPMTNNSELYFSKMIELKKLTGLRELSMGMSADYLAAIKHGSSFVRIGSKIFGPRT